MNTSKHNIDRVYSGKPGCMCGCNGKYSSEGRGVSIIYNRVMNHPNVMFDEASKCAYVTTETRNLVVYFKD